MSINPSAPNSYHVIQDDGGDAIDISLAEGGVTEEQAQKVLDYFKSTGLFAEVLYHDAGSGLHLHLGGLNTDALSKMPARTVNRGQVMGNGDGTSTEAETSTDTNSIYQRLIADILNEDTKPLFDATGDDETTRSILSAFAADKRTSSAGNDFIKLSSMFDENDEFINSKANRKTLADLYGDDLVEFGQAALDERLAQLADKNSSVENLTVDDRKLLSGVLKAKLEDAGTKVGGHFLKRLNEGDADTFNKVLGSLGSVKQTALPENLSNEISRLRDEIKNLSDKAIQTSDKAEFADINKQIKAHDAKINSIQTLGKDIAKLEAELQKASDNFVKANATGNATKIATASDKVTKLQTQLDAKQAELTKIISPQVQDATPAPSKQFAPLKAQGEEAVAKRDADIREANDKIAKWTAARVEKRTSTRPSRT